MTQWLGPTRRNERRDAAHRGIAVLAPASSERPRHSSGSLASPRPAWILALVLVACSVPSASALSWRASAGFSRRDQTYSRDQAIAALDSDGPWCTLSDGGSLDVATALAPGFGCTTTPGTRCVVLEREHLDERVFVTALHLQGHTTYALPSARQASVWLRLGVKLGYASTSLQGGASSVPTTMAKARALGRARTPLPIALGRRPGLPRGGCFAP